MLWLVRHAPVELDLERPAHTWELTPDGRAAAEELALRLPPVSRVLSSPEPKAVATAEPIARAAGVELDERLREVRRETNQPDYDAHRHAVRRYLAGEAVDGWEPREQVVARVREAVAGVDNAVVVSHGMALSLLLGYGFDEWNRIALPGVIEWEP